MSRTTRRRPFDGRRTMLLIPAVCVAIGFSGESTFVIRPANRRVEADDTGGQGIIVNSRADIMANDGNCTLREAIGSSNSGIRSGPAAGECAPDPRASKIGFAIPGPAVAVIAPRSPLPPITRTVTIDGYTQKGSRPNSRDRAASDAVIRVEIDGAQVPPGHTGLDIRSPNTEVRGLAVHGFKMGPDEVGNGPADVSIAADSVVLAGVYAGTAADGLTLDVGGEEIGVLVMPEANDVTVGGPSPSDRNVLAGRNGKNQGQAVAYALIFRGRDGMVANNFINLGADGHSDLGGIGGLVLADTENVEVRHNVISGAQLVNLLSFSGGGHTIQDNFIGTDATGHVNPAIANGALHSAAGDLDGHAPGAIVQNRLGWPVRGVGVSLVDTSGVLLGGTNQGDANLICGVSGIGVAVERMVNDGMGVDTAGQNNAILGNEISAIGDAYYPSAGLDNSAIDIMGVRFGDAAFSLGSAAYFDIGPEPNDAGDTDPGPNGQMNAPELNSATLDDGSLTVRFSLDTAGSPSDRYRVEFFASNGDGVGDAGVPFQGDRFGRAYGADYLGSVTTTTGLDQLTVLRVAPGQEANARPGAVAATATALTPETRSGYGSTGPFSTAVPLDRRG